MKRFILITLLILTVGCSTYNPYQDPHIDWQAPELVPLDERRAPDVGKMCLGEVA